MKKSPKKKKKYYVKHTFLAQTAIRIRTNIESEEWREADKEIEKTAVGRIMVTMSVGC